MHDFVSGTLSKDEFKQKYEDARFRGDVDAFRHGDARGVNDHITG